MSALRFLAAIALLAACAPQREPWGRFEPEAGRIADAGRDATVHVFPSGKILVLAAGAKPKAGLGLHASEDGGDSYSRARSLDGGGEVEAHGEGRPVLRVGPGLEEYAVWSERDGKESKRLSLSRSVDYGRTFSKPATIAPAGAATFFDFAVAPSGRIALAWLSYSPVEGARAGTASIEAAISDDRGETWSAAKRIAIDVCPCCRPRLAVGPGGVWFVAWRGVEDENVRDVFVARASADLESTGAPVRASADGWKIDGCPHCGASLVVVGDRLWIAWATGAGGEMRTYAASSPVADLAFGDRSEVGAGLRDVNHPELAVSGDRVWVAFQARETEERASFAPMKAWVAPVGDDGPEPAIAAPRGQGSALYPALAPIGEDKLLVAWTDSAAGGTGIATARLRLTSRK